MPFSTATRYPPSDGAQRNGLQRHGFAVFHQVNKRSLRSALNGGGWDKRGIPCLVSSSMRTLTNCEANSVLSSLVNSALNLNGAGGGIDLTLSMARSLPSASLMVLSRDHASTRQRLHRYCRCFMMAGILSSGMVNIVVDRLQLRHDDDIARIARMHDVAGIDLPESNAPFHRRSDFRIIEIAPWRCRLRPGRSAPRLSYCLTSVCLRIDLLSL